MYAKFCIENVLLSSHCLLAHSEAQPNVGVTRLRLGPAADHARVIDAFLHCTVRVGFIKCCCYYISNDLCQTNYFNIYQNDLNEICGEIWLYVKDLKLVLRIVEGHCRDNQILLTIHMLYSRNGMK